MTSVTKRKYVYKETLENFDLPNPNQTIVQIVGTPGCNLHRVITPFGEKYLASLPTKFRKTIWIKRGDYAIVEPIEEGVKVKAEIVRILYPQHIKFIKDENMWPAQFQSSSNYRFCDTTRETNDLVPAPNETDDDEECSDDDDFSDIPVNMNRPVEVYTSDTEDESSDDED